MLNFNQRRYRNNERIHTEQTAVPLSAICSMNTILIPPPSTSGPRFPLWGSMITLRHTKLGRTPLDELSTHRRDPYLTTHNTLNRQTSMPPARFEPAIPASERPQTHVLDCAATGTDSVWIAYIKIGSRILHFQNKDWLVNVLGK